ncbi:MAG: trypsin-like peptidase domain-containing protein [SAR202 cluster bacterium]|nr:trypsin-like peptidase domain-containing protein [SAR202 cluster bacterium]
MILLAGIAIGVIASTGVLASTRFNNQENTLYDEELVDSIVNRSSKAVVEIIVKRPNTAADSGTGFILDKQGHIATNEHVINGASAIQVSLADGTLLSAEPLGVSKSDDLALLVVNPKQVSHIEPLKLANSDLVKTGQMALAIGNPLGMRNFLSIGVVAGIGDSPPILRDTRISPALQRPIPNMIWTDATLLPGNSGGPLLNSNGEVIGINSAVHITYQGDLGIGFAIPSNILIELLPNLKSSNMISRPWLGISGITLNQESIEQMNLDITAGVYIWDIYPDSPADINSLIADSKDGTINGDIIVGIDGLKVTSVSQMVDYLNSLKPMDMVNLTVLRDAELKQIEIVLGSWPPKN